ncbi:MAG: transporter substrate-binding domain-containing protein [Oscillospiraceae bacterium]|jgi:ABC-type amino acid transport substrate-binding protein|nr:transporter substrate-binding domain-containing protein [Oscillospiraceae bacterium]
MKRAIAIALSLALLALAAGCSGKGKTVNSPDDFEGARIAVQDETTADESITEMKDAGKNITITRYPQVINCFDDLRAGRVDAVYVDSVVAAYYTTGSGEYSRVWLSDEAEPLGICLKKGSDNLLAAIEAAVDTLYYNGKMGDIARKHFGDDPTASLRTVTSAPVIPPVSEAELRTPGVLSIGADVGYPPMEYYADDGTTMVGFDIDVGEAIAELLGLKAEVIDTAWDGIFAGVERGDYDCIISSVSITPARQAVYLLTEPYVANALCVVVKKK